MTGTMIEMAGFYGAKLEQQKRRIEELETANRQAAREIQDYIDGDPSGLVELEIALDCLRKPLEQMEGKD